MRFLQSSLDAEDNQRLQDMVKLSEERKLRAATEPTV